MNDYASLRQSDEIRSTFVVLNAIESDYYQVEDNSLLNESEVTGFMKRVDDLLDSLQAHFTEEIDVFKPSFRMKDNIGTELHTDVLLAVARLLNLKADLIVHTNSSDKAKEMLERGDIGSLHAIYQRFEFALRCLELSSDLLEKALRMKEKSSDILLTSAFTFRRISVCYSKMRSFQLGGEYSEVQAALLDRYVRSTNANINFATYLLRHLALSKKSEAEYSRTINSLKGSLSYLKKNLEFASRYPTESELNRLLEETIKDVEQML